jgi:site-specific DNA-methyltransferase (adenine-specific)/adenine-specific DNA-methyltransferase
MVDFDYNDKEQVCDLDKTIYASEIEKNNWEIHLPLKSIKDKMMVIYLDIYGNEYREIKNKSRF